MDIVKNVWAIISRFNPIINYKYFKGTPFREPIESENLLKLVAICDMSTYENMFIN